MKKYWVYAAAFLLRTTINPTIHNTPAIAIKPHSEIVETLVTMGIDFILMKVHVASGCRNLLTRADVTAMQEAG